jgi:hypothetical protein
VLANIVFLSILAFQKIAFQEATILVLSLACKSTIFTTFSASSRQMAKLRAQAMHASLFGELQKTLEAC